MSDKMFIEQQYKQWLENVKDEEMLSELNNMGEAEKVKAFSTNLDFGTGGLRGVLGVGTAKMNTYNVAKVTRGLIAYLNKNYTGQKKVAIASDPRQKSDEFINLIISILAEQNIKAVIYDDIKPTPMLSYLVRAYNCQAGIMITASHNPKEYNGYKVYNETGAQLNLEQSALMIKEVYQQAYVFDEKITTLKALKEQQMVEIVDGSFDEQYFKSIEPVMKEKKVKKLKIVFTPEHGTTYKIVPKAFKHFGFTNLIEVTEQMIPDGNFSNTKSANPEDAQAYELALDYAQKVDADLIIANDPDGDRLGIMFKNKQGKYVAFSGNQTGTLLIDYLIKRDNLTTGTIYKTIVTGELGANIAKAQGLTVEETLTGFKFIGEKIENNSKQDFVFGYEESYGYLINDCVRDKDAIQSSLLIAQMTQYYKDQNLDLQEVMNAIYKQYGYNYEVTNSISLTGTSGMEKIKKVMKYYQEQDIQAFCNYQVVQKIDYNEKQGDLPKADVIKYYLQDLGWLVFRPSGTEPKLKVYVSISSESIEKSTQIATDIYQEILDKIENI
ncbi:MAG: phospho-sugar mutase [Mycoplasmatales bacterium]